MKAGRGGKLGDEANSLDGQMREKPAQNVLSGDSSIYPPCPMAAPVEFSTIPNGSTTRLVPMVLDSRMITLSSRGHCKPSKLFAPGMEWSPTRPGSIPLRSCGESSNKNSSICIGAPKTLWACSNRSWIFSASFKPVQLTCSGMLACCRRSGKRE